ncbi:hypothetical protein GIB67_037708 [Kingdonia uniflora]|uniref:Uncharacterized protein n=1 Tax=Kingdonia uniflora TaxID=39325 RepID=A0A7J7P187_9MAGN|nr:hypothetical protein GIB67_037708 [Kingdonia uniflora]
MDKEPNVPLPCLEVSLLELLPAVPDGVELDCHSSCNLQGLLLTLAGMGDEGMSVWCKGCRYCHLQLQERPGAFFLWNILLVAVVAKELLQTSIMKGKLLDTIVSDDVNTLHALAYLVVSYF